MLQFKAPKDLDSHPAYPLVQDLVNHLIVNFSEDRLYYPHWVVSGKPIHRPLSIWSLVWIMNGSSVTLDGLSGNSVNLTHNHRFAVTALARHPDLKFRRASDMRDIPRVTSESPACPHKSPVCPSGQPPHHTFPSSYSKGFRARR